MTIPRGFIPGSNPQINTFEKIIVNGTEVINSSREINNINKCQSPEIQDLLSSIQFDYVYNWDALPENYDNPWTQAGGVTPTISGGILTIDDTVTDNRCYYSLPSSLTPSSGDVTVIQHHCKETNASEAGAVLVAYFTNGSYGGYLSIYNGSVYLYSWDTSSHIEIISGVNTDEYNTYTIYHQDNHLAIYINNELKYLSSDASSAPNSIIRFGTYSLTGTGKLESQYFRYTVVGRDQVHHNNMKINHTGGAKFDVINDTPIGSTTPSSGKFSELELKEATYKLKSYIKSFNYGDTANWKTALTIASDQSSGRISVGLNEYGNTYDRNAYIEWIFSTAGANHYTIQECTDKINNATYGLDVQVVGREIQFKPRHQYSNATVWTVIATSLNTSDAITWGED